MERTKELLLQWLNDAHAMEKGIVEVLTKHAKQAKDYPEVAEKILEHLEETKGHALKVESTIKRLGGKVSKGKDVLSQFMGNMKATGTGMTDDALVKNGIAEFTTEYFEIACYRSIASAAEVLGDSDTIEICEEIIAEEQATADWLEENLPLLIKQFLNDEEAED